MARSLKVFRTAIGFHDAYVAAPSRKAALAAWGASADLFARGVAEEVDDPALIAEPLAHPGTVVRRSRGSAAEQLAALPPDIAPAPSPAPQRARPVATLPKPSRAALADAEAALADAEAALADAGERYRVAIDELAKREARIVREREDSELKYATERARLDRRRNEAQAAFDAAMQDWTRRTGKDAH